MMNDVFFIMLLKIPVFLSCKVPLMVSAMLPKRFVNLRAFFFQERLHLNCCLGVVKCDGVGNQCPTDNLKVIFVRFLR